MTPSPPTNWSAVVQNCLAILAILILAVGELISGNAALVAILAVVGVIVYPALKRGGGRMGSIGIFAASAPALLALLSIALTPPPR